MTSSLAAAPPSDHSDRPAWVRQPQQARSQDTLARLLDAAEALLEELPWDGITVAALVHRGRSSVGAFYARFPDKDSLLQHLHARRSAEAMRSAEAALAPERWRGVPLDELIGAIVSSAAREYIEHAGFHREIVRRNSIDARFRERSSQVASHTCRMIANLLEERRDQMRAGDTLAAADMVHRILFSVLDQHAQFYDLPAGVRRLAPDQLVDEIVRACLGYLGCELVARREG